MPSARSPQLLHALAPLCALAFSACGPSADGSPTSKVRVEALSFPEKTIATVTADASGAVWATGFATGSALYVWDATTGRFEKKATGVGFNGQAAGGNPVVTLVEPSTGCCTQAPLQAALLRDGQVVKLPPLSVDQSRSAAVYGVDALDTVYASVRFGTSTVSTQYDVVYRLPRDGQVWEALPGRGRVLGGLTQLRFTTDGRVLEINTDQGVSELQLVEPDFVRKQLARPDDPALSGTPYDLSLAHAWGTDDLYAVVPGTYDVVRLTKASAAWELVARPGKPPKVTHLQQAPLRTSDGNLWLLVRDGNSAGAHGLLVVLRPGAATWELMSDTLPRQFNGWALPDGDLAVGDGTDFGNFAALLHVK